MLRVQAAQAWGCNFYGFQERRPGTGACAYCSIFADAKEPKYVQFETKRLPLGRQLTPEEWADGTRRIVDAAGERIIFDLTGGEPTLYPGLPRFLHLTKDVADWAVTSNTVLTKQIHAIFDADVNRCSAWTASWHPGAKRPLEPFLDNLRFIRHRADDTSVTIVLHQSTKHVIREHLKQIQDAGFRVQIHLYLSPYYSFANDKDQEIHELYEELKAINKAPAESFTDDVLSPPHTCIAGHRSVAVSSDGAVFSCYKHMASEPDPPIGYWGTWTPKADLTRGCMWACVYACDLRNTLSQYYMAP